MIASNHRALSVLFPVSQQGATALPNSAGDMSNCFMVLEKSDFELLQVRLDDLDPLPCPLSPSPLSSQLHTNLVVSHMPGVSLPT